MSKNRKNNRNNKKTKPIVFLYCEKQKTNDTCRVHAINNAVGRSILSKEKFFEYCDQFDMQNHCKGSREFFFIDSDNNIINFILNKFHIHSSYYPPDNPPDLSEDSCDDVMAVITFDDGHIWSIKKYDENDTWYELDSLSNGPKAVEFESIFTRKGFGWIIVWNSNKSISNSNQPTKSSSSRT